MTSEVQIFSKDKVKLNILHDVLGGLIKLGFQLENGAVKDYATAIHEEGKRVNVLGKFNLSEDVTGGDSLTIRPIMIDAPLKILFQSTSTFSGKKASVVRGVTKAVEQEFEISSETTSIEFVPQGKQHYTMRVSAGGGVVTAATQPPQKPKAKITPTHNPVITPIADVPASTPESFDEFVIPSASPTPEDDRFAGFEINSGFGASDDRFASFDIDPLSVVSTPTSSPAIPDIPKQDKKPADFSGHVYAPDTEVSPTSPQTDAELQRIEREISVIERQQNQLSQKKQSAIDHLAKIEAEYKKDYASLEKELEDVKSRMEADASIIEHYKDQDVLPVEVILREARLKLDEAEEQIRFFIEAKQRKTMEIENEIKSNKKQ